ncbi:Arm DNA-binding domain-containing protein, partial [Nostoc sp. NIES-2111]
MIKAKNATHPPFNPNGGKRGQGVWPTRRLGDGNGLLLLLRGPDTKAWVLRYTPRGAAAQKEMGLGRFAVDDDAAQKNRGLTLAMARKRAAKLRAEIEDGKDPIIDRRVSVAATAAQNRAGAPRLFSVVVEDFLASHEAGWKNLKHAAQWKMTLKEYAGPVLG